MYINILTRLFVHSLNRSFVVEFAHSIIIRCECSVDYVIHDNRIGIGFCVPVHTAHCTHRVRIGGALALSRVYNQKMWIAFKYFHNSQNICAASWKKLERDKCVCNNNCKTRRNDKFNEETPNPHTHTPNMLEQIDTISLSHQICSLFGSQIYAVCHYYLR